MSERLKAAMARRNIDQATLADRSGCTQGAISQILLGKTQRSRFLPDIAGALGVDVSWLRGEGESEAVVDAGNFVPPAAQQVPMMVTLPSEAALTDMFRGLLTIVPDGASKDDIARILARRLPIGFAAIGLPAPGLGTAIMPVSGEDPLFHAKSRHEGSQS